MERIPILRMGEFLIVTIQVDMHDRLVTTLQDDLTTRIADSGAHGAQRREGDGSPASRGATAAPGGRRWS